MIGDALAWRVAWRDEDVDHEATFPETVRFVRLASDQILVGSRCVSREVFVHSKVVYSARPSLAPNKETLFAPCTSVFFVPLW